MTISLINYSVTFKTVGGVSLNGSGDVSSPNFNSVTQSGNLIFTGTGNRITGDFSNATVANRVIVQSSTTNGATDLITMPNGSSHQASFIALSNIDPANTSMGIFQTDGTGTNINSFKTGTGSYLPIIFLTGGSERMRIDTSGNVSITGYLTGTTGGIRLPTAGPVYFNAGLTSYIQEVTANNIQVTAGGVSSNFTSTGLSVPKTLQVAASAATSTNSFNSNGSTTGCNYGYISNTSGNLIWGVEGSAGAQVLVGTSAYTSCIGTASATSLQFGTNNTVRATIDSTGRFGVGITPNSWGAGFGQTFELRNGSIGGDGTNALYFFNNSYYNGSNYVAKNTAAAATYIMSGGSHTWYASASVTAGSTQSPSATLSLDSAGNLSATTAVSAGTMFKTGSYNTILTNASYTQIYNYAGTAVGIYLGNGSSYYDSNYHYFRTNAGAASTMTIDSSGNVTAVGNVTAYSDERLKKDWSNLPVDFVKNLAKVKSGTYTRTDQDIRQVGVSAQSLQELLPEAVLKAEDGMLSVSYGNAALAACVQLAKRVVELEARLAALENKQ